MCQRWVTKRKALFNHLLPRGRYSRVIRTGCTVLYCTRMYGVIPTVLGGWFGSAVCTRSQRLKTSRNRKRNTVAIKSDQIRFILHFIFVSISKASGWSSVESVLYSITTLSCDQDVKHSSELDCCCFTNAVFYSMYNRIICSEYK